MANLKYEEAADRYDLPLFAYGDIVMCEQHDKPLMVVRVGWNGEPSPYYGDHVWKAWCESTHWDQGDHFADWIPLTALTVIGRAEAEMVTVMGLVEKKGLS